MGKIAMHDYKTLKVIETVIALAEEIARGAPEFATKAMQIIDLMSDLDGAPDRAMIEDAIETSLNDSELSDPQVRTMTSLSLMPSNPVSGMHPIPQFVRSLVQSSPLERWRDAASHASAEG
jgi:hypothetical protein